MVKRSNININFQNTYEYSFINHYLNADSYGPVGTAFASTTVPWNQNLDSNGWPNNVSHDAHTFGLGARVPASTDYTGKYVLTWDGNGEVQFNLGTWTIDPALSSNYTAVNASRWHGTNSRIVVSYTGPRAQPSIHCLRTNRDGSGNFIKNVRFYRLEDEADLLAGKVFRTGWKQTLADLNPGTLRFMNWTGHNACRSVRFRNRLPPSYAAYTGGCHWTASPPYPDSTGVNAISVASATGMPVAMTHGEVVTCRIANSTVRNGSLYPTNITKANPAVVSYDGPAFVPQNGDVLVFQMAAGMVEMNYRPVTVANINTGARTFECAGLNTSTGFTTFAGDVQTGDTTLGSRTITNMSSTAGIAVGMICFGSGLFSVSRVESKTSTTVTFQSGQNATATATGVTLTFGTGSFKQYITLDVGSRGAYPVIFGDGSTPASNYGDGYIVTKDYKTFSFDKELVVSTLVTGAWIFQDLGAAQGYEGTPPLEICTALVNELMAMTRSDGGAVGPIALWITIPHRGMLSMDPDYDANDNYAVKSVDVCLNGANGYAGLNSSCDLIIEFSNETWNSGGSAFDQTPFLGRKGQLRYGGSSSDFSSYTTLRAVVMVNDIKTAFPSATYPRVKYVMCGQGTLGVSGTNAFRINGGTNFDTDPLNVWGGDPITHFNAFGWAAYFVASSTFDSTNLANYAATWVAATTDADKEAACALYVAGLVGTGTGETTSRYGGVLLPAYATELYVNHGGRETWMYEGGWDRAVTGNTTDINNYLIAVKKSRAWANALKNYHNMFDPVTGSNYPADYIELDPRWGHASPDLYSGGVEGANLDLAWKFLGMRNRNKRQMLVRT